MKTKTFTLVLLALFLLLGTARTSGQTFSLGAKVGAGISYFSNFDDYNGLIKRSPNIMVDGGVIANLSFTQLISLQFEILYEQKGEKYKMTLGTTTQTSRFYLNYLTLPILVEFSHSFGNFNLFGGLGPYMGYALNGKIKNPDTTENIEFGKDKFRRFDVGASVDLGVGYKAGPGHIFLDLRYNYGLMDIQQPKDKPEGYKSHCNRNFGIYLGYLIPLGKSSK